MKSEMETVARRWQGELIAALEAIARGPAAEQVEARRNLRELGLRSLEEARAAVVELIANPKWRRLVGESSGR